MTSFRSWAALASVGLAVSAATVASGVPAAASTSGPHGCGGVTDPVGRAFQAAGPRRLGKPGQASTSCSTCVTPPGPRPLVNAVSDPASAQYRHYLTDAQWIARYAPTQASVASAETWLRAAGLQGRERPRGPSLRLRPGQRRPGGEPRSAPPSATSRSTGHTLRLANSALSIPTSIAGIVSGVTGVNEGDRDPRARRTVRASDAATAATPSDAEPPPPAGFRNPQPC